MAKKKAGGNNVVMFPPGKVKYPLRSAIHAETSPKSLKQIRSALDIIKQKKADEIIDTLLPMIVQGCVAYGVNLIEEDPRYFAMVTESLRSLIFKHYKMPHPVQELTEVLFEIRDGKLQIGEFNNKDDKKT